MCTCTCRRAWTVVICGCDSLRDESISRCPQRPQNIHREEKCKSVYQVRIKYTRTHINMAHNAMQAGSLSALHHKPWEEIAKQFVYSPWSLYDSKLATFKRFAADVSAFLHQQICICWLCCYVMRVHYSNILDGCETVSSARRVAIV